MLKSESLLCNPTLLFNWSSQGERLDLPEDGEYILEVSLGGSHAVHCPSGAEGLCCVDNPLC